MMQDLDFLQREITRLAKMRRAYARGLRKRGWTLARIAKEFGISRQRVGQLVRKR